MSFKTRTIRLAAASQPSSPPQNPFKKIKALSKGMKRDSKKSSFSVLNYFIIGLLVLFGMFVVVKVTMAAYKFVSEFTPGTILEVVGSDLKKDEHGYTNILLLGDGGFERDGAGLMDTIMVASIDFEKNGVSMLSIPRDYYITKTNNLGLTEYGKINEIYVNHKDLPEEERFEVFKDAVGQLVNLDIQYYMRIDFNGFVEVVDSVGGITVDVPKAIYDPTYPNKTDTGFSPFKIEAGIQELDGEMALKYARSRHTTSDFDRAARQQLILEAIRQKALSAGVLTDVDTLQSLYSAINDNFNSDLTLREMASLGAFAEDLDRSHVVRKQLHNNPLADGGFLYDGQRAIYGASVLLPDGDDLELIHQYADLLFNHREIYYEPAKISVLNATGQSGIAGEIDYELTRFGFLVEEVDNYLDESGEKQQLAESLMEYVDWTEDKSGKITPTYQATMEALGNFVNAKHVASDEAQLVPSPEGQETDNKVYEGGPIDIKLILGGDYKILPAN